MFQYTQLSFISPHGPLGKDLNVTHIVYFSLLKIYKATFVVTFCNKAAGRGASFQTNMNEMTDRKTDVNFEIVINIWIYFRVLKNSFQSFDLYRYILTIYFQATLCYIDWQYLWNYTFNLWKIFSLEKNFEFPYCSIEPPANNMLIQSSHIGQINHID